MIILQREMLNYTNMCICIGQRNKFPDLVNAADGEKERSYIVNEAWDTEGTTYK